MSDTVFEKINEPNGTPSPGPVSPESPGNRLPESQPEDPVTKLTTYVVLREAGNTWIVAAPKVPASGPREARSTVANQIFEESGDTESVRLVAISSRHFQPKTLRPRASWNVEEE